MEVYVGTSGWLYDWNLGGSFDWYLKYSGLNAVELNASFYRFPFKAQVLGWARRSFGRLRWSVKVHRSITHYRRLSEGSLEVFSRFRELFTPLEGVIDFYMFQLPPNFSKTRSNIGRLERFSEAVELGARLAVEFRHESWFNNETVDLCRSLGATIVSIDSPIATWITSSNNIVYLRMHGRSEWYAHDYTREELDEIAEYLVKINPAKAYVFFNNNHWMLENARTMLKILTGKS
ncbi:MAG: DUF72 domain-containing protein [Thermoprotei archaeon]|nr:DUF72 domain-containing protein [Thermoprotei archaeon]